MLFLADFRREPMLLILVYLSETGTGLSSNSFHDPKILKINISHFYISLFVTWSMKRCLSRPTTFWETGKKCLKGHEKKNLFFFTVLLRTFIPLAIFWWSFTSPNDVILFLFSYLLNIAKKWTDFNFCNAKITGLIVLKFYRINL